MESVIEQLDIHSNSEVLEDHIERFEIWCWTRKIVKDDKIVTNFLRFIGKDAYSLLKILAFPNRLISLPYKTLKKLLLSHVKCTGFECRERAKFHRMIGQNIDNSTTSLSYPDLMRDQSHSDNNSLRRYKAGYRGEHRFGKCLFCSKFYSCNSCVFQHAKCFKCGKIRYIQAVCNTTVRFSASSAKLCNSDPIKLSLSNDHLSLITISENDIHIQKHLYTSPGSFHDSTADTDCIKSYLSPELDEVLLTFHSSETKLHSKQVFVLPKKLKGLVFRRKLEQHSEYKCIRWNP